MSTDLQVTVHNGYGAPDTQATLLVPRRHKMETPKVSVIMPVYNAQKDLRATLESVLAQTLKEIEIICVDDGSTDPSVEILKEYAAKDDRLIILTQQNHYAGVARNTGMTVARGEFLSFLDSDDIFEPAMLEDAYTAAKRDGSDIAMYGHYECGETVGEVVCKTTVGEKFLPLSPVCRQDIGEWWFVLTISALWNKLFRRETIHAHGLTCLDTRSSNDMTFACSACALAERVSLLPGAYVYYRRARVGNLTTRRNAHFADYMQALVALKANLQRYGVYKELRAAFKHYALGSCLYELSLSTNWAETAEKLEKFGQICGKALSYRLRGWVSSGPRRYCYRIISAVLGAFERD